MRLSPIYLSQLAEAKQEGIQQGIQQNILAGMEINLQLKFGSPGLELLPAISQISDISRLESIQRALLTVTTRQELQQLIAESAESE